MNDRQESKLSRFIEKYGITQEEVNSIFAKKQEPKQEEDDDLLEDDEPDTKEEPKAEVKEETKTEEVKEEPKTDENGEEVKGTEEVKTEEVKAEEEKTKTDLFGEEMKKIFESLGARIDVIEEALNSLKEADDTKGDFGVKGDQQNKAENSSTDTFTSLSRQLGAK